TGAGTGRAAPAGADRAGASGTQRDGRGEKQRGDRPGAVRLRGHREDPRAPALPQAGRAGPGARGRVRLPRGTGPLVAALGERVVYPVGVAARVFPGDVVVRVGVVRRLVYPGPAGVEQVPQVTAEEIPVEVVRFVAVFALDHQTAYPDRGQQGLVDLQIREV